MPDQQQQQLQQQQKQQGAVRLGVKMNPPTVLVEYRHVPSVPPPPPQTKKGQYSTPIKNSTTKLRCKSIRLHNLGSSKDSAQDVASALSHEFPKHFGHGIVSHSQLVTLIAKLQGSLVNSSKSQGSLSSRKAQKNSPSSSKVQGSLVSSREVKDEKDDGVDHLAQGRSAQRGIAKETIADEAIARETTTQSPKQHNHQGCGIVSDREKQWQGGDIMVSDGKQQHQGGDAVSDQSQQQQHGGNAISDDVGVDPLPAIAATVLGVVGEQRSEGSEGSAAEIKSTIESTTGDHAAQSEKCGDELVDSLIRAIEGIGDKDTSENCEEELVDSLIRTAEEDEYDFDSLQSKAASTPPQATPVYTSDGADLNKISEAELVAAKSRMDVMFQQNQLLPGEQGYAHDVRRDFGEAEEDCDWDDED